jgi:hypothetical protein
MLVGARRTAKRSKDTRLPITGDLLSKIILSLPLLCNNLYEATLFSAVLSTCFFCFLRACEVGVGNGNSNHVISIENVASINDCFHLLLKSSKTDQLGSGSKIVIGPPHGIEICPVKLLTSYLSVRPKVTGPLFCHYDGKPITRYQISAIVSKSIANIGLDPARYSSHSLRIGAATTCALEGHSDVYIMAQGRWKSHTYKSYIRIPNICS